MRRRPSSLAPVVALALAVACEAGERRSTPPAARYDADSAARGLLPPELSGLLAVDSVLDDIWLERHGGRCRLRRHPNLGHAMRRIDAPLEPRGSSVTVFTRTTPQGELRKVELLHRAAGRPLAALSWDASTGRTVLTEWSRRPGGPLRRTTTNDPEGPLVRGMKYVGRRANGVACISPAGRDSGRAASDSAGLDTTGEGPAS